MGNRSRGLAAGATLAAGVLLLLVPSLRRRPPDAATPAAAAGPSAESLPLEPSLRVADPGLPLAERLGAIEGVADAEGGRGIARLLSSVPAETAGGAQVRAALVAALGRFPDAPETRDALLAALASTRPRSERLLALSVLASLPRGHWARGPISPLARDADPAVREKAIWALDRLRD